MKKFFTLCAAFATLLSVEAAPQFIKKASTAELKPIPGRQLTHRANQQKPVAMYMSNYNVKKGGKPLSMANPRRALGDVVECAYDVSNFEDYTSDVWFTITTTDGAWKFYIDILGSLESIEVGKTYTLSDCDAKYTYVSDNSTYAKHDLTNLEVVFAADEKGFPLPEAKCTDTEGTIFHLYYQELVYPESFTDVTVTGDLDVRLKDFTATDGAFQFIAENDQIDMALAFASESAIVGTYTTENVFEGLNNFTYLYIDGKEVKLCDVEAEVKSLGANNYHIDAKMYGYDGNCYIFNLDYIEPTAEKTIDIIATNLNIDDSMFDLYQMFFGYGMAFVEASNDEYTISGSLVSYSTLNGHYVDDDHHIDAFLITDAEDNVSKAFTGDLEVEKIDDSWTIKGSVLCWDNVQYNLDLSFTIPEIKGEASYTCYDGELIDLTDVLGAFQIYALNENDEEFSVVLNADEVVNGNASYNELSSDYLEFSYISMGDEYYQIYNADFEVLCDGQDFMMHGTCQAGDLLFNVIISGVVQQEEEPEANPYDATLEDGDIDVSYSLEEIDEFGVYPSDGIAYLSATSEERMDQWRCLIYVDGDELPAGEYPITNTYTSGTVQDGEIYGDKIYPTIYFKFDEDGYIILPTWYCVTGSVTVDYDEDGNIMMECNAYNTNGCSVHVVVNGPDAVGIQEVAAQTLKDGKFYENNAIVIRSNGSQYNTFGQLQK